MLSLIDGLAGGTDQLIERFHYVGPFLVLLLCGVGLPLPEEVTLIGSGILVYQGEVEFVVICAVCACAILIGDSAPYLLGKRFGPSALRIPWVARVLHPERFAQLERRFAEHGNWVVFTCRFLPGIRIPGYFVAGTMGMSYWRFLLLDALGVLVSVPVSIWLGYLFGGSVEVLHQRMKDLHLLLAFLLVSVVIVVLVRVRILRKARARSELASGSVEAGEPAAVEDVHPPARTKDA